MKSNRYCLRKIIFIFLESRRPNHRWTAFYCILQARVSQFPLMCWHHHLRSPPYKGPSRWLWMDSDSQDVSRQCISKNDVCKIKSPLTFFLSGFLSGQRQKEVKSGPFRSGSCSTASSGLEIFHCISFYFLVSHFCENCADIVTSL